ncbi:MAG TPA: PAS domain S-box protein [Candidatus Acidoferrales bacterium]|nr:PAS domain S-box protein [Candidatus Acidoferrales bacterium]
MSSRVDALRSKRNGASRPGNGSGADAELHPARIENPRENSKAFDDPNSKLLFSGSPHAMYIYDPETLQILEVNAAAIKQYGYSREEFLQLHIPDLHIEEEVPRLQQTFHNVSPEVSSQGIWRQQRKTEQVFQVEVTTQGIRLEGRAVIMVTATESFAKRSVEEKVAENSAYLQALTENNPLAIVVLDSAGRIQMCNPAFENLFGYYMAEILGKPLDPLLAVEEELSEAAELTKRASNGEVIRTQTKRRRSDGRLIDVQVQGVPLVVKGKRTGCFAMYEDISEHRRAEEARRQAEEKFRSLFENAVEGIFQSTPEGRFLSVNPALARMCGYSSPKDMVESVHDLAKTGYVDPTQRDEYIRLIEERGTVENFEYQIWRKDGEIIWVSENSRAIRDKSGRTICYEGTVEDVTERRRSELERQATFEIISGVNTTNNLDELLHRVHAALCKVLYAENCFVALCDPGAEMFHFPFLVDQFDIAPPPQRVGRSCTAYVYRTGRAMLIPQMVFDQLVMEGEVELVGTPSPSWLGVPLKTPAATIGVLVVQHYEKENAYTQRDLEFLASVGGQIALAIERKRADEKVREGEERLRVLMEQLPAVLWTVDRNLRFTSALGAGLARLGLKPERLVGTSLLEYFETEDRSFPPIAAHRRAVAGEPVTFHLEWKNGSYTFHVEPMRASDGELLGAICMALDVTDRKQLEEQFRQAQKMEAVGRLAGGIAHDFNNLLMVIQGYADLLTDRLPEGEGLRRNAEQIQMAAQRATGLTRQLLAFSRKQMLAPKVLNIQSIISEMEKILRRLIGEDVELLTSSESDLWLVKADRSQIEQVVMNLAVNARDAMPQGGRLTIEACNVELDESFGHAPAMLARGKYVLLAVTDNGIGMDAETQAHIFEPFYTTKEKGKGTGLGLATVYGIVKQSGGYIWVYSEPGHGTTFKIYLPRIEEESGTSPAREGRSDTHSLPKGCETVLLVEDEKGVRELAREYLQMLGYKVIDAEAGHTALELASMHAGSIDLLMTDVVMPGISGRELAQRVLQVRPGIKILYMSGYTDQAVVHHGILEDDAILLQKPFTLATLASKLREILAAEPVR